MPFHLRAVEPQRVCRLKGKHHRAPGEESGFVVVDGRKVRKPVLFSSLEDVCSQTLTGILLQLSDLSRHASDIFLDIETQAGLISRRSHRIQLRLEVLQGTVRRSDPKKTKIPVSNLDEESKWTVHYSAPYWHQQENVFLPASRPACVEDLHRQAKVNLKTVLRECDKLRKDGFRSSQYYSQGPMFSGPAPEQNSQPDDDDDDDADDIDRKSAASSMEEENSSQPMRAQTPVQGEGPDTVDAPSSTKGPALPTPEQRMRQQAQAVITDIVPINVTGERYLQTTPTHSL
ncbi:NHS-like protein 1 [Alosa pseudoharengus]|uniref:NHS-like protein 1 n=1 Tax=Alosa pseudoharengus TaxID=34774 RepID=UPI003F8CBA17